MKCHSCSHEVPDDAAFCGACGAQLPVGVACPACGRAFRVGQRFCSGCGARLAPPEDVPAAPTTMPTGGAAFVHGRYRVERFLGEGAHKRVYLACDTTLDRWVAFAQIKGELATGDLAERIRREARAMARLPAHPNVVAVYDAGEDAAGPYIVEEYVDGGTVEGLLKRAPGRPLAVDEALRIAAGACSALDHAHAHGIVHRDLKPANLWLTADGTPKLGDFGLVVAMRESRSETLTKLTHEGALVGTLAYMAPEQALGKPLDPRSDVYSLGAMLYELVTGQRPFAGEDAIALVAQHLRTPPVAPILHNPELPGPLSDLILWMLAKVPRERPESAAVVRASLDDLAAAERTSEAGTRPHAIDARAAGLYVGREQEIDELCGAVDRALAGSGEVVLVTGDPGIGKTRLVEQVASYAQMRDAQVLWGRCYEGDGAPPYWPWSQIIRAYVLGHDPEAVAGVMGAGAPDIAQMESEVGRRLPGLAAPPRLGAEEARFRLFDSVTRFVVAASRTEPLVLVLDDLHCADRSSLLLLEFLARELGAARVLVVGTYRGVELHAGHDLTHTLAELVRVHPPRRIALGGLTRAEVAHYMETVADAEPAESLVSAVFDKSEGNPFFLAEIVRLLDARARVDGEPGPADHLSIPGEVREVIGRRLDRLSDPCRGALTVAALMGRDFHLRPLQEVVGLSAERLFEALDEAAAAQVIAEAAPGRYRFSHVLICDTLAAGVTTGSRIQLHYKIGAAIEQGYADRLDPWLSELAHHYLAALPAGHAAKALQYATAAAEAATARLAHEEAARLYEEALGALEPEPGAASNERRCDLLLKLGHAHASAGATAEARGAFGLAADLARRLASPERLAHAALGIGGPRASFGVVDQELVELLEDALTVLGDRDPAWRVRVLARLATELSFTRQQERRAALVDEAVGEARELDDPLTLAYALNARHSVLWGPANASERLAVAGEVVALAEHAGDRQLACEGRNHRVVALLETGDVVGAAAEIDAHARLAEELRQPFGLWQATAWRSTMALLDGRFEEGQALADQALTLGRRVRASDAEHCFAAQTLVAAMELGRLTELLDSFRELSERFPATNWRAAALPFIFGEVGRREEAAELFEAAAEAEGFTALPKDYQWLISVTALADACSFLGDARRGAELYGLLLPYAGQSVFMPEGWICFGTVDRALGLLAATIGKWETAEAHLEAARALDARLGARAWLARTNLGYARMLLARGWAEDAGRARALLVDVAETTHRLGMIGLAGRVEEQLALAGLRASAPAQ